VIRICAGKPAILQADNRWGVPEPHWYLREPGWVSVEQWMKLLWFESPVVPMLRSAETEVRERLKLSNMSTLWQFEAVTMDLQDRMRMIAVLGERTLVAWTWADYYIRRPLLKAACLFKNSFSLDWLRWWP
jgi:hypothetical protein